MSYYLDLLHFPFFSSGLGIFQSWKCRGPMFGIGIYYSLYACYATLQSHWWCLASDGTSKHSFFCIKQMLETGSLFSIKCFLNAYIFFPSIERSINLGFSSTLSLQITSREDVVEVLQARFWEVVPGHTVGSLRIQVLASFLFFFFYGLEHEGCKWFELVISGICV